MTTDELNPYAPPNARLEDPPDHAHELASRWSRLLAGWLDGIAATVIGLPFMWSLGVFEGWPQIQPMSLGTQALLYAQGLATFLLLHGYLLAAHGQTLGKRVLGIRIVRGSGGRATFGRLLGLRYGPLFVAGGIPFVGQLAALVDALFIFASDRRCLHDRIADTIVIRARS